MIWNPDEPLARMSGETQRANDALYAYWLLGPGRSMVKLRESWLQSSDDSDTEPPTRRLPTLKTWSAKFDWQARIQAATLIQQAADEAEWLERRRATREADWRQAEVLRDLADKILAEAHKFIIESRRLIPGKDGKPDLEIITVSLDVALAIKSIETGSKLARLAADLDSDRTRVTVQIEKEIDTILGIAEQVLGHDAYKRLLDAITGIETSG